MAKTDGNPSKSTRHVVLNCDKGRTMGCASFCCALIVRLGEEERDPTMPEDTRKNCVDKDPETGRCIHQDLDSGMCRIWEERPQICRDYDCNNDDRLQIVLRSGFGSLLKLALAEKNESDTQRCVPYLEA